MEVGDGVDGSTILAGEADATEEGDVLAEGSAAGLVGGATILVMTKLKLILIVACVFFTGIVVGGYLFAKTQPRSFLSINSCNHCLAPNELAGLVGSVAVNSTSLLLAPAVIMETDKTVVIKNPVPEAKTDYVVIPKKDIKDAGELSDGDKEYLADAYAVMERIIQRDNLRSYEIVTYGPGRQQVRYLHFHLESTK